VCWPDMVHSVSPANEISIEGRGRGVRKSMRGRMEYEEVKGKKGYRGGRGRRWG
jgi:hypothetical protein